MGLDTRIFLLLNGLVGRGKILDFIIIFFARDLAYILVVLFGVYLFYSAYSYREKIVAGVSALVAALVARYGITSLIRFLWHRPRPFVTLHVHQLLTEASYSFPSGHSTFFFAFSTVVYHYHKKLGVFFFVTTIIMTLGRVASGIHYPSDILAGLIIGVACGWCTLKYITPVLEKVLNVEVKLR